MSNLTFGVEFEFMIAEKDPLYGGPDPNPEDSRQIVSLSVRRPYHPAYAGSAQTASGRFAMKYRPQEYSDKALLYMTVCKEFLDNGIACKADLSDADPVVNEYCSDEPLHTCWLITTDITVGFNPLMPYSRKNHEGYRFWSIEINSPAFLFCPQSLKEVEFVCAMLTNKFRIHNNTTCSIHVHVGGHNNMGFTLNSMKALASFMYLFESQINSINAAHRWDTFWAADLRLWSAISQDHKWQRKSQGTTPSPLTPSEAITRIYNAESKNALARMIRCTGRTGKTKCNLMNLETTDDGRMLEMTKRTAEFRQHEGTLDGKRVTNWITTVVGIMRFCQDSDSVWSNQFFSHHAAVEEDKPAAMLTTLELFEGLGLHDQVEFYKTRLTPFSMLFWKTPCGECGHAYKICTHQKHG